MFTSQEKKHFQDKILLTRKKMWDLEFVRKQLKQLREEWRSQYDRLKEQEDAAVLRLEQERAKEDPDATIVANLENLIKRQTPDLEQFKKNMQAVDSRIEGGEGPEGHQDGINETLEGHRANLALLEEHIKTL